MGFPSRIPRSSLGPTYQQKYPVNDSTKELSAQIANLFMWQLAGCNLTVPMAWAEIEVDAGDVSTLGQSAEAWDTVGAIVPVLTHPGVGRFTLTYATSYPDDSGNPIAIGLRGATPCVQSPVFYHAQAKALAANVITVYVYDAANAADDPTSSRILVPIW